MKKVKQNNKKVKETKARRETIGDFSTFRDVWTPVTCRALQQKSSKIDPNVAFAPTDIGIGCCFPDISSRVKVSQPRAGTPSKKRCPPKGPGKPRDLLVGDSFYHRCLYATFCEFSTFRNKFGEQGDSAHTFSNHRPNAN